MQIIFSTYETKEIGGSYLRSLSIAQELVQLGDKVTLWTSAKKISLKPRITWESGVKVIESVGLFPYRFRRGGYDPFDLLFRSFVIFFSKCEVIHSFNHRPVATWPALLKTIFFNHVKWFVDWADLWGKGGIADRRSGPFNLITKNIDHYTERLFIRLPYAVTPISDDLVRKAKEIRKSSGKVFFLGVGANTKMIKPMKRDLARVKLDLPKKNKILVYLYVGTYDEELLANIFIELCRLRFDVQLMLLGPSLPVFEKILSTHKSVSKKVLRKGIVSREKLPVYLASGDLMMMPFANKEINLGKFPNKLGDYLAAGRPIAANPTGEVVKMFKDKQIGILLPEQASLFAKGVNQVLNQPINLIKWGKNARLLAEQISWLTIAKQLKSFYLK